MRYLSPWPLAVAILAACSGNDSSSDLPNPVRRDSATVRIVEYPSLQSLTARFAIDSAPFLEIGGSRDNSSDELDPRHPYFTATWLSDRRIVINDFHRIIFFDSTGKMLYARGREGHGPGEFGQVQAICRLPGDSLLVFSIGRDVHMFDPTGNLVRSYARIRSRASDGCFDDGSIVASLSRDDLPVGAMVNQPLAEDESFFVRVRPSGEKLADLGRLPTSSYKTDIIREVSIVPFREKLYAADAKTFEVREQSLDGKLLRILRVAFVPKAVPPNAAPDFAVAGGTTLPPEAVRPPSLPPTYPVYGRVRVDPAGRVWIQDYDARQNWTVFDSTFALLGRVSMRHPDPKEVPEELVGFQTDHVVILRYNPDGAPVLSFHRISGQR